MRAGISLAAAEIKFLSELVRHDVPFMIVGVGAAALQGAPLVTQDIDLWFKDPWNPGIQRAAESVGGIYVPPDTWTLAAHPPMLGGRALARIDVVVRVQGVRSFDAEYRRAVCVYIGRQQVRAMSLDRIIRSKAAADRPKDRAVLPILRDVLGTLRGLERIQHGMKAGRTVDKPPAKRRRGNPRRRGVKPSRKRRGV